MLEFVYSDITADRLRCCMNHHSAVGGRSGTTGTHEDGTPLTEAESEQLRQQQEEEERYNWDGAVPLEGDPRDILSFPLALDLGPLDDGGLGPGRLAFLEQLFSIYPDGKQAAAGILATARTNLDTLLARATDTPVRFWLDRSPGSVCAMCWGLEHLQALGLSHLDLQVVDMARLSGTPDEFLGGPCLEEVKPPELGRLAQATRPLSADRAKILVLRWQELKEQNAPLRASLNGVLVSAGADLYDPYLEQALGRMTDPFGEGFLLLQAVETVPLGFGMAWFAQRLDRLVADGRIEVALPSPSDLARYYRILRKRAL